MNIEDLQSLARTRLAELVIDTDHQVSLQAIELSLRLKSDSTLTNAGEPWKPKDAARLLSLFEEGKPLNEIADVLGRTVGGVKARLKLLGKEV